MKNFISSFLFIVIAMFVTVLPGKAVEPAADFTESIRSIFAGLSKGTTIAFVQFTEIQGKVTPFSQAVLQLVEPIIVKEGLKESISFIERQDLKLILDEWDLNSIYQTEDRDAGAQALLGADYILTGKAGSSNSKNIQCSLKLVNLTNGRIVKSVLGEMTLDIDAVKQEDTVTEITL